MTSQIHSFGLKAIAFLAVITIWSCSSDDATTPLPIITPPQGTDDTVTVSPDVNADGQLNILIIGTSQSINNSTGAFATNAIATQLNNILSQDAAIDLELNISFEDIYRTKEVPFGLGQAGNVYDADYYAHSLMQYYYWPEGQTERLANLANTDATKWDYVVIAADPYIVAKLPGYYALGVNKVASKIAEGGAKPMLLMVWPKDEANTASIALFEEFTYRTSEQAKVTIETIPAGLAWQALPNDKKDTASQHPTPNGAYVAAASIYSQIVNKSAATSDYSYDDAIADIALTTKTNAANTSHYTGERSFVSPYKACDIADNTLNYNHTGTSSENGILNGLHWVFNQSSKSLVNGGTPPINFNYGRANTNFEPNKRYKIDPSRFDFSFGFPMQDHANHGNTSMLYGIDKRYNESTNGTDLGTALYMVRNNELPTARAVPVRTLYAQLQEAIPGQSAFSDNWHMHGHLDKAIGAFMYTMLTGDCALGSEPADTSSNAWQQWMAHKIGYETAYTVMYLNGVPACN